MQVAESLQLAAVINLIVLSIATVVFLTVGYRLYHVLKQKKHSPNEFQDLSLPAIQAVITLLLAVYTLGCAAALLTPRLQVPGTACKAKGIVLYNLYNLCKACTFWFLSRKAQIVDFAGTAHKHVFWALRVLILAFFAINFFVSVTMKTTGHLYSDDMPELCKFQLNFYMTGVASVVEILLSFGAFFVFVKPLISLIREIKAEIKSAGGHSQNSNSRISSIQKVIVRNLFAGMLTFAVSLLVIFNATRQLGHGTLPTAIMSMAFTSLDLLCGCLCSFFLLLKFWFPAGLCGMDFSQKSRDHQSPSTAKQNSSKHDLRVHRSGSEPNLAAAKPITSPTQIETSPSSASTVPTEVNNV